MRQIPLTEGLESRRLFSGDGLSAQYFDQTSAEPRLTRVDAAVDFNWRRGAPAPELKKNRFNVVWTGQVEVPADGGGVYTFATRADDVTRLWVNGEPLIDNGKGRAGRERSGTIELAGGGRYDIRLEYGDRRGRARVSLLWSGGAVGDVKTVVPQSALYSTAGPIEPPSTEPPPVEQPPSEPPTPPVPPAPEPPTSEPPTSEPPPPSEPPPSEPPTEPPPPGVRTIVIDPAGPITTLAQAATIARAGDVVLILPGTYHESVTLTESGEDGRPIVFAAADGPGTVTFDGTGLPFILDGAAVSYVHLQGLDFDGCDNSLGSAAVRVGSHWEVTDTAIRHADGQGISVSGSGARLYRVTAENNGQHGIGGADCSDVLLQDCVTRFNNAGVADPVWAGAVHTVEMDGLWYVDPAYPGGAGTWYRTDGVTIDGLQSYGNGSSGVWFDTGNTNVTVRNSTIYDNRLSNFPDPQDAVGIRIETSPGPVVVENNTVRGHPDGNVLIWSSRQVKVRGNTLEDGPLVLNDGLRNREYPLRELAIHNNVFKDATVLTAGSNWGPGSAQLKRIVLDGNEYETAGGRLMLWGGQEYRTLEDVRSRLELEFSGTVRAPAQP